MLIIGIVVLILIVVLVFVVSKGTVSLKEISKIIDRNDYERAKALLQKHLSMKKFSSDAHFLMARIYENLEHYDYALMELKSIVKNHDYGNLAAMDEIYRMMGDIYLKLNKLDEAHQQYLMLEKEHPDEYNVAVHLGRILFYKKQYEQAIAYYNKALKLRSSDSEAMGGIGMCYFQLGDMKKAHDNLDQAVKLDKRNFLAHYYYALYYHKHQLFDYAISEYEQAMHDKDLKLKSIYGKAKCYQDKEVNVRAVESYEQAVDLIEQKGDKIRDFKKRTGYFVDPFILEIRYKLARAYIYDKNFSGAMEQWQEIASVSPDYQDVRQLINENSRYGKDRIKDFLIMKEMDFEKITRYIVNYLGYIIKKLKMINKEQVEIEAQPDSLDVFQGVTLILLKRSYNPVGERDVSSFYERMQKLRIKKGLVISATGSSPNALKFALGKPIDFAGKNQVMRLLKRYEHRV